MAKLQIINDSKEFIDAISKKNNDLFLFKEDAFEPIDDILDRILYAHNKYGVQCIYTDLIISDGDIKSNQYYLDIENPNLDKIILSPIACVSFGEENNLKLLVQKHLKYQSFNILKQLCKHCLPWHIPELGFRINITQQDFHQIMQECQWVVQNVT